MAGPTPEERNKILAEGGTAIAAVIHPEVQDKLFQPAYPDKQGHKLSPVEKAAARLYANGYSRPDTARKLVNYIVPKSKNKGRTVGWRMRKARARLRNWEVEQWFRDAIYEMAVLHADLNSLAMMEGVVDRAKAGRVDAARLAFEMSGRHNPKGDTAPTAVVIQMGEVPRPHRLHNLSAKDLIEGKHVGEE